MIFIFSVLELFTFPMTISYGKINFSYLNIYSIYGLSAFSFNSSITPYSFSVYFSGDSLYEEGVFVYRLKKKVDFITMEAGSGFTYLSIEDENNLYPYFQISIVGEYKNLNLIFSTYIPGIKNTNIYRTELRYSKKEYGIESNIKIYNTGIYTISSLIYLMPFEHLGFGIGTTLPQGYINFRLFLKRKETMIEYRMFYNETTGRGDIFSLSFYL